MVNGRPMTPEPEHAADAGEEHAAEDHQGVAERVEREVEQAQDQGQGQRHDDEEPPLGPLQVLELAAPLDRVAGRELHLAADPLLGLLDERADVAAPDVGLDDDPPLAPLALDGRGARSSPRAGRAG